MSDRGEGTLQSVEHLVLRAALEHLAQESSAGLVGEIGIHQLTGDGDFRSEECVKLLKQADIVVTNPPFSLFREYVEQLVKRKK